MQSRVEPIPRCAECEAVWLAADRERWRAYLGCDEDLDEPAEVVILCPTPPSASSAATPRTTREGAALANIR